MVGPIGDEVVDLSTGGSGGAYPGTGGSAFGGMGSGAASFKARLDAARDRQWRFQGVGGHHLGSGGGHGHGHGQHGGGNRGAAAAAGAAKRAKEGWRGLPERGLEWIMGDREEREKEKEKERRRAMDNWI